MESDSLVRLLQDLTGQKELWEGFDPSAPVDHDLELGSTADNSGSPSAAMEGTEDLFDAVPTSGGDVEFIEGSDWELESTGPADMVLGLHKLSVEENAKYTGKQSKARKVASGKSSVLRNVAKTESVKWEVPELKKGEASESGQEFCPWKLIQDYPELFVGKRNGERARPMFTLDGLHQNRVWDLYYVYDLERPRNDPLIFVPSYQFQHHLDVVNAKLDASLTIPDGANTRKFMLIFGHGNTPQLRFLGRSGSEDEFLGLMEEIPPFNPDDKLDKATEEDRAKYLEMMASIFRTQKKAKKSEKNRAKRIMHHIAWGRSIKRTQRYLGLREATREKASGIPILDLNQPMTPKPEGSVLFIAIDIEAYELNQDLVTEVGIAMLDTNKLVGVAPGEGGKNWFSLIDARHIRVKENSWVKNGKHVHGCPDRFDFGQSEFVPQREVPALLEQIIDKASLPNPDGGDNIERSVVLVFHESAADIKYLRAIDYNLYRALNVIEVIDTREMSQYNTRSKNQTSLESVLGRLGIASQNLHNGGNDAVYTLRAMISLAVERRVKSLVNRKKEEQTHIPWGEFNENEGWTSGEDSDGGDPVRACPEFESLPLSYRHRD